MPSPSPWSIKGIPPEARALAKEAAQKSGMTLGQWLSEQIAAAAAEEAAETVGPDRNAAALRRSGPRQRSAEAAMGAAPETAGRAGPAQAPEIDFDALESRLFAKIETRIADVVDRRLDERLNVEVARLDAEADARRTELEGIEQSVKTLITQINARVMRNAEQSERAGADLAELAQIVEANAERAHTIDETLARVASAIEALNNQAFHLQNAADETSETAKTALERSRDATVAALNARAQINWAIDEAIEERIEAVLRRVLTETPEPPLDGAEDAAAVVADADADADAETGSESFVAEETRGDAPLHAGSDVGAPQAAIDWRAMEVPVGAMEDGALWRDVIADAQEEAAWAKGDQEEADPDEPVWDEPASEEPAWKEPAWEAGAPEAETDHSDLSAGGTFADLASSERDPVGATADAMPRFVDPAPERRIEGAPSVRRALARLDSSGPASGREATSEKSPWMEEGAETEQSAWMSDDDAALAASEAALRSVSGARAETDDDSAEDAAEDAFGWPAPSAAKRDDMRASDARADDPATSFDSIMPLVGDDDGAEADLRDEEAQAAELDEERDAAAEAEPFAEQDAFDAAGQPEPATGEALKKLLKEPEDEWLVIRGAAAGEDRRRRREREAHGARTERAAPPAVDDPFEAAFGGGSWTQAERAPHSDDPHANLDSAFPGADDEALAARGPVMTLSAQDALDEAPDVDVDGAADEEAIEAEGPEEIRSDPVPNPYRRGSAALRGAHPTAQDTVQDTVHGGAWGDDPALDRSAEADREFDEIVDGAQDGFGDAMDVDLSDFDEVEDAAERVADGEPFDDETANAEHIGDPHQDDAASAPHGRPEAARSPETDFAPTAQEDAFDLMLDGVVDWETGEPVQPSRIRGDGASASARPAPLAATAPEQADQETAAPRGRFAPPIDEDAPRIDEAEAETESKADIDAAPLLADASAPAEPPSAPAAGIAGRVMSTLSKLARPAPKPEFKDDDDLDETDHALLQLDPADAIDPPAAAAHPDADDTPARRAKKWSLLSSARRERSIDDEMEAFERLYADAETGSKPAPEGRAGVALSLVLMAVTAAASVAYIYWETY